MKYIDIVYGKDKFYVLKEKQISLYVLDETAYKRTTFQDFRTSADANRVFDQLRKEIENGV